MNEAVKHCFATQKLVKKHHVSVVNDEMAAAFSKASIPEDSEPNDSASSKSQLSDVDSSSGSKDSNSSKE